MRSGVALIALSLQVLGCTPEKTAAYQRLANEVNPIFVTLVLKVAAIQALAGGPYENEPRLAAACASADVELARLRAIDFDRETSIYPRERDAVSEIAGGMIEFRRGMCRWPEAGTPPTSVKLPVDGTSLVLGTCRWWCLDVWSYFTRLASELEAGARAEGVHVIQLPHVPAPKADSGRYLPCGAARNPEPPDPTWRGTSPCR